MCTEEKFYVHYVMYVCTGKDMEFFWSSYTIISLSGRGVYREAGEVDATCVQFGSTGERIPALRGEEFPQIYGSYIIYKSFLAQGSHLQLHVCTGLIFVVSYITARCTPTYLRALCDSCSGV